MICTPMPTVDALQAMYGQSYLFSAAPVSEQGPDVPAERDNARVIGFIRDLRPGVFVDYGCGRGRLLQAAADLGWKVVGFEFDDESAARISTEIKLPVHPISMVERLKGQADVVHLGDVIEHLCYPNEELLANILPLLKPGGYLLAQGPLREYNLFGAILELSQFLRNSPRSVIPPYHVLLPSPYGQRVLFQRLALREITFKLGETNWPAPTHLTLRAFRIRDAALLLVRVVSQGLTQIVRSKLGNRFFYAGQVRLSGQIH